MTKIFLSSNISRNMTKSKMTKILKGSLHISWSFSFWSFSYQGHFHGHRMRGSNFQRTYYIYVHTNKLPIHASIYALDHSQVLYIYYKLLQCRCLHFIETRIQILHYSSRKQVHSIIQTNLNANCSSTSLLCFYIDVYLYM